MGFSPSKLLSVRNYNVYFCANSTNLYKAVGVQITASVTRNMMRVYIWSEICSVIEMVPITLSQCLFRLSSRREKDVELTLGVKVLINLWGYMCTLFRLASLFVHIQPWTKVFVRLPFLGVKWPFSKGRGG